MKEKFNVFLLINAQTGTPFYVGCGQGTYWKFFLTEAATKQASQVSKELRKMWQQNNTPVVKIIQFCYSEERAQMKVRGIIQKFGSRRTGGILCNRVVFGMNPPRAVEAWGVTFPSMRQLARDPRCIVPYSILRYRIRKLGQSPEIAATTPRQRKVASRNYFIGLWGLRGMVFESLEDVARYPSCPVTIQRLRIRVSLGEDINTAATRPQKGELAAWGELFKNMTQLSEDIRCDVPYHTLRRRILAGEPPGQAAQW